MKRKKLTANDLSKAAFHKQKKTLLALTGVENEIWAFQHQGRASINGWTRKQRQHLYYFTWNKKIVLESRLFELESMMLDHRVSDLTEEKKERRFQKWPSEGIK